MSETLEIFKPLKTYFAILCESNCNDYSSCKELINVLTTKDCGTQDNSELSDNFKNALSWFAAELKKADSPVGVYTIKNRLKEIFINTTVDSEYIKNVINVVNNSTNLNGFKMGDSNGEDTYENILNKVFDVTKSSINIFEEWFASSFDTYVNAEKYFKDKIKDQFLDL